MKKKGEEGQKRLCEGSVAKVKGVEIYKKGVWAAGSSAVLR